MSAGPPVRPGTSGTGTDRAPDVFDLGPSVAIANADLFAPYKVQTWEDVPAELKDPDGRFVSDYGGLMSIGYDAGAVPAPTSVETLKGTWVRRTASATAGSSATR